MTKIIRQEEWDEFSTLKAGEMFFYHGELYMKLRVIPMPYGQDNAVSIESGELKSLDEKDSVIPVDVEVVVK